MANRFLSNLRINDAYTLPSTDGSDGQAIVTDGTGNLSFGSVAAATATSSESTHLHVKNTSGSLIAKGTPVYITGNVGNTEKLEIAPADASSASTMPAVGLLESDLANNGEGFVVQGGFLKGLATGTIDGTSTSANDTVYVKSGGGLTMTKPTGASNLIQNIAKVARVHGSNGSLVVSSILRANDVPNLPEGKIWVGDGNTTVSTIVHLDELNGRVGIGTTSPQVELDIASAAPQVRLTDTDGGYCDVTNISGNLLLQADKGNTQPSSYIRFDVDAIERMRIDSAGDISFRDTSNNEDFYWDASTGRLGIGTTSPSHLLTLDAPAGGQLQWKYNTLNHLRIEADSGGGSYYAPAGLYHRFFTSGAERLRIDSSGNVGIGVSPSTELHVKKDSNVRLRLETTNTGTSTIQFADSDDTNIGIIQYDHSVDEMYFDVNNSERMRIDSSGNVGIGTDSPVAKLHVSTGNDSNSGNIEFVIGGTAGTNARSGRIIKNTSSPYEMTIRASDYVNGNNLILNDTGGNVGIGTDSPNDKLHVNGGSSNVVANFESTDANVYISFKDDTTSNFTSVFLGAEGNNMAFYAGNASSPRMRIDSNGRVGIGTTSPAAAIHAVNSNAIGDSIAIFEASATKNGYVYINAADDKRKLLIFQSGGVNKFSMGVGDSDNLSTSTFFIKSGIGGGNNSELVIDSSGNVGIGTDSPDNLLTLSSSGNTILQFNRQDPTINNGNRTGVIHFGAKGSWGTNLETAKIWAIAEETFTGTNNGTGLRFFTTSLGESTPTERLRIAASGNVGINETNPDERLSVTGGNILVKSSNTGGGDANNNLILFDTDTTGSSGQGIGSVQFYGSDSSGAGAGIKCQVKAFYASDGDSSIMTFSTSDSVTNNQERMRIDSSGNVGIGMTPSKLLDLQATDNLALRYYNSTTFKAGIEVATTAGDMISTSAVDDFAIRSNSNILFASGGNIERMRIDSNGDTTFTGNLTFGDGHYIGDDSFDNLLLQSSSGENLILSPSNDLIFYTGGSSPNSYGTQRLRIFNSDGRAYFTNNVGIGTDSPSAKLHVYNSNGGDATSKASMLSEAVLKLQPHATNSTNLLFAQVNGGNGIGLQVTNGSATANWDLALSPFGGNVGIGVTSPSEKLEVAGNVILDANNANIKIKSGVAGTKGDIQWLFNSTSTAFASIGIEYDNRSTDGLLIDSGYAITLDTTNYTRFSRLGAEHMRITSVGNVGIGTNNPSAKLVVTAPNSNTFLSNITSTTSANIHQIKNDNSKGIETLIYSSAYTGGTYLNVGVNGSVINSNSKTAITTVGAFDLLIGTNSTERMRITSGGSVTANVDMRAPIFYDSDNTGYYVDPATTSNLNAVKADSLYLDRHELASRGISWYSASYKAWSEYMSPSGTSGCGPTANITAPYGAIVTSWAQRTFIENAANYGWTWESGSANGQPSVVAEIRSSDGLAQFNGGVRAPIFYDSDNTNYYVNPAGDSSIKGVDRGLTQVSGWVPAYGGTDENNVSWSQSEDAVKLQSPTDTTSGAAFKARRIAAGQTVRFSLTLKANVSASSGVYIRLYVYNGDLPDGKTHTSVNASNSSPFVQEASAGVTNWRENVGINTSWTTEYYSYTATADCYVSMVVLNWTGVGTNAIYVKNPDIQTIGIKQSIYYDLNDTAYYVDPASTTNLNAVSATRIGVGNSSQTSRYGISLYGGYSPAEPTYGILFTGTSLGTHGAVTSDWATYFTMNNTANRGWIFRNIVTGNVASINNAGTAHFNGDVVASCSSDERLKDNKKNIENALKKVESLNGVEFDWNDKQDVYEGHDIGVIAQEVEKVLPEIVNTRDNGYKAVKYEKLVPLLIEAIKELSNEIKELKNK